MVQLKLQLRGLISFYNHSCTLSNLNLISNFGANEACFRLQPSASRLIRWMQCRRVLSILKRLPTYVRYGFFEFDRHCFLCHRYYPLMFSLNVVILLLFLLLLVSGSCWYSFALDCGSYVSRKRFKIRAWIPLLFQKAAVAAEVSPTQVISWKHWNVFDYILSAIC